MKPDLSCECGGRLFGATPVFQTFADGRCFELTSSGGEIKNVWVVSCLSCTSRYVMGRRPHIEHANTLLKLGTAEATEFMERFTTDGVFSDVEIEK